MRINAIPERYSFSLSSYLLSIRLLTYSAATAKTDTRGMPPGMDIPTDTRDGRVPTTLTRPTSQAHKFRNWQLTWTFQAGQPAKTLSRP